MSGTWETIAARKRGRLQSSIPSDWRIDIKELENLDSSAVRYISESKVLSSEDVRITNLSAVALVAKLAAGELTSVEVTLAFCKRAALAHQLVRICLILF